MRIAQKHCNARGTAHGGLSADFAGGAKLGDWLEARVDIQKLGGRLAFANAYLTVGDERIVRASAVFVRGGRPEA